MLILQKYEFSLKPIIQFTQEGIFPALVFQDIVKEAPKTDAIKTEGGEK